MFFDGELRLSGARCAFRGFVGLEDRILHEFLRPLKRQAFVYMAGVSFDVRRLGRPFGHPQIEEGGEREAKQGRGKCHHRPLACFEL
jgi:hypothetical protein